MSDGAPDRAPGRAPGRAPDQRPDRESAAVDPESKREIDLLIVDLDGTLVDSFADIERSLGAALASLGAVATPELIALAGRGTPLEGYYRAAFSADPEAADHAERFAGFVAAYRDEYNRIYQRVQGSARVYPGVAETLATLRRTRPGMRLAVGTSKRTDVARVVIERAALGEHFDLVQGSDDVAKKPDPALLQLIARTLHVPLARAAMVGDTQADTGAARAAGCLSIAVTYGGQPRHELEALEPDRLPDHLIDRFSDVLELL